MSQTQLNPKLKIINKSQPSLLITVYTTLFIGKEGKQAESTSRNSRAPRRPENPAKMLCILCLTPSNQVIHIFEDEGVRLNICSIITQHFSLQPSAENANNKVICNSCWSELSTFHKFYQKVEDAHSKLISSWSAATDESKDILSTAIRIAGIKPETGEDSDVMETSSSSTESDYDEATSKNDAELRLKRTVQAELDQVIRQHIKLKCNICQEPMRNFFMLKRHFESIHNESGYVICCKLKFKRRSALADHIYLDHNQIYLCDKCGQVMSDCRTLNVHKTTHTNNSPHVNVTSAVTVRFEKTVQTCNTDRN